MKSPACAKVRNTDAITPRRHPRWSATASLTISAISNLSGWPKLRGGQALEAAEAFFARRLEKFGPLSGPRMVHGFG